MMKRLTNHTNHTMVKRPIKHINYIMTSHLTKRSHLFTPTLRINTTYPPSVKFWVAHLMCGA